MFCAACGISPQGTKWDKWGLNNTSRMGSQQVIIDTIYDPMIPPNRQTIRRLSLPPMPREAPLTITVPEAGSKYFGLSRNASYEAAARGEIPTIRVGRLLRVPIRAMERMLDEVPTTNAAHPPKRA